MNSGTMVREGDIVDRSSRRDQRLAERDAAASRNTKSAVFAVVITSLIVGWLALEAHLPTWEALLIGAGIYACVTMAAALMEMLI